MFSFRVCKIRTRTVKIYFKIPWKFREGAWVMSIIEPIVKKLENLKITKTLTHFCFGLQLCAELSIEGEQKDILSIIKNKNCIAVMLK